MEPTSTAIIQPRGNRLVSADYLKCAAIFGVVFIHSSTLVQGDEIAKIIFSAIFRYCVPIFIILWAYFFQNGLCYSENKKEYIKNKFLSLFVPYLFWTMFYFFIVNDLSSVSWSNLVTGYWSGYGWAGQYFFIILFQLIPLFAVIVHLLPKSWNAILGLFLFFFIGYVWYGYFLQDSFLATKIGQRFFIFWIPYVLFGVLIQRSDLLARVSFGWKTLCVAIMILPTEVIILRYFNVPVTSYITPAVLVSSILIAGIILTKESFFSTLPSSFNSFVVYISKRTLSIFCMNPLVIILIKKSIGVLQIGLAQDHNIILTVFLLFCSSIFVFFLCVAGIRVFEISKFGTLARS